MCLNLSVVFHFFYPYYRSVCSVMSLVGLNDLPVQSSISPLDLLLYGCSFLRLFIVMSIYQLIYGLPVSVTLRSHPPLSIIMAYLTRWFTQVTSCLSAQTFRSPPSELRVTVTQCQPPSPRSRRTSVTFVSKQLFHVHSWRIDLLVLNAFHESTLRSFPTESSLVKGCKHVTEWPCAFSPAEVNYAYSCVYGTSSDRFH